MPKRMIVPSVNLLEATTGTRDRRSARTHPTPVTPAAITEQFGRLDRVTDVAVGQDVQHARYGPAVGVVDIGDTAVRDRAGREEGEGRVGQGRVGGIARLAGYLEAAVDAGRPRADPRRLSEDSVHDQMLIWAVCRSARTSVRFPSSRLYSL